MSVQDKYLVTTVGKIKFNEILPDAFQYLDEATKENIEGITPMKKHHIQNYVFLHLLLNHVYIVC